MTYLDGELSLQEIQSLKDSKISTIEEDDTARLSGHLTSSGKVFLHMKVKGKFTKSMLFEWRVHFLDILDGFKAAGKDAVYSLIPEWDEKAIKFNVAMGFRPIGEVYAQDGSGGSWVLKRDI